jgi:hypothetical protein
MRKRHLKKRGIARFVAHVWQSNEWRPSWCIRDGETVLVAYSYFRREKGNESNRNSKTC